MNKKLVKQICPKMVDSVEKGRCPFCGKDMKEAKFKDALSEKEFRISGMCQECQDKIFN